MDLFSDCYITRDEGNAERSPSQQFNVVRRVYQQDALNKDADYQKPRLPLADQCKKVLKRCGFGECLLNSVPIIRWLPKYNIKQYLVGDLIAGATTAVMHIPQGMAYALLAEVPPVVGLYMAFFPVLIYVLLGTSPHISMGTFAVACLMAGKVVVQHSTHSTIPIVTTTLPENSTDPGVMGPQYEPLQVLSVVCLTVGVLQTIMWVLRLGAVATLLSEPLVSGFTTAASFQVLASQLKDLLGVPLPKYSGNFKVIVTLIEIFKSITFLNYTACIISIITCFIIALNNELLKPWVSKRSRVPVPIELLAIVTGTLVSKYGNMKYNYGISLVGNIPTGLPAPKIPPVELMPSVALDSFTIMMVTYTISMSMALIFAAKEKYEIDGNQELLALGASNIFASFFGCSPFCASLSRSYIQYQAGSKTGITSIVSASLILCVLLWVGPFFEDLPRCVLASIIVVSLKGLYMQALDLGKFWRLSKLDACVWVVTFLVTLLVNIDIGLGAGLLASVCALFCRSQQPYTAILGRVLNTDIYLDIKRYRAAEEIPGIKIFHYCGGLNFATKNLFRKTLFRKIGYMKTAETPDEDNNLTKSESYEWDPNIGQKVHCVIIDATALSYVDAPGVKTIVAVQKELVSSNITLLLAGANGPVLEMIERYNKLETEGLHLDTFPTVHDAVVYYMILESKKDNIGITLLIELLIDTPKLLNSMYYTAKFIQMDTSWLVYFGEYLFAFHIVLQIFLPALLAEMVNTQVDSIRLALHELLLNEQADSRVVAGWPAQDGQIPHQISLRMVNAAGAVSSCGGSIIHHEWVITAAHCLANRFTFVVRLGLTNLTRPEYIVEAHRKYIYPAYNEALNVVQPHDIALLGLEQHIPYGPYIQPCRLQNSAAMNNAYTGTVLTVSGYGLTDDAVNGGTTSEILNFVYLRGISNEECSRWYTSGIVQPSTICAEYYNDTAQSSCQGDSGGPLTEVSVDGKPTMVGVVSFGSSAGCNSPFPSAYIRPGHYHDWYVEVTGINFDWRDEDLEPTVMEGQGLEVNVVESNDLGVNVAESNDLGVKVVDSYSTYEASGGHELPLVVDVVESNDLRVRVAEINKLGVKVVDSFTTFEASVGHELPLVVDIVENNDHGVRVAEINDLGVKVVESYFTFEAFGGQQLPLIVDA